MILIYFFALLSVSTYNIDVFALLVVSTYNVCIYIYVHI